MKTALITTLKQFPVIFWQFMFIAVHNEAGKPDYWMPVNMLMLAVMVGLTFAVAYKTEGINRHPWWVYLLIFLSPMSVVLFGGSSILPALLFLCGLLVYVQPWRRWFENTPADYGSLMSSEKVIESLKSGIAASMEESKIAELNSFPDLLKRGNLPDDDREVPNWLKLKNEQFDDVDVSHNPVNAIIALSNAEFDELVSSTDTGLFTAYLSTLSDTEMERFYQYCDDVVKLDDSSSARAQFEAAIAKVDFSKVSDEQRVRATLEMPLAIQYAKYLHHQIVEFICYSGQDNATGIEDEQLKAYEYKLVTIIWAEMKYIPNHFEQVMDQFQAYYDDENPEHRAFFEHLCERFGLLIATLRRLMMKTEGRVTSLNWFAGKMAECNRGGQREISIINSKHLTTDKKLINLLTATFSAICDEHEDTYLCTLICVVEALFEWYPVNRPACEYAMVEMMKSIATKEVRIENANSFLAFFEQLPRLYNVLDYEKIIALKSLINHTLANHKPQENKVFELERVKNKLILLNYLVDMEDLYYESGKQSEAKHSFEEPRARYFLDTPPFGCRANPSCQEMWNQSVLIPTDCNKFMHSGNKSLRTAPEGMYRLIGYYDYSEHFIADYDAWDAAHAGLKDKLGSLHADNQLTLFIYNEYGDCLAKGSVENGVELAL